MKIIYCQNCLTFFTPKEEEISKCSCGLSSAQNVDGIIHYSGPDAKPLNIPDRMWSIMFNDYMDITAFLKDEKDLKKEKANSDRIFATKVIEYLNQQAGTAFSTKFPSSAATQIIQRRDEHKIGIDEFIRVINNKVTKWKGTEFEQYLRPATLFNKTKFANYLGEKNGTYKQPTATSFEKLTSTSDEAKRNILNRGQ